MTENSGRPSPDEPLEHNTADEVRTALIVTNTRGVVPVQYVVVDGEAIFEGDISLGTVEQVEARTAQLRSEAPTTEGIVIPGSQFRWQDCRVPYTIDGGLPNQQRMTDAIAHWEAHTNFRFPQRTTETDYVTFRLGTGCSSAVGRQGGQQFINLAAGCDAGRTIHEIGHAVGLWHEQSREDRDTFVQIHWDKIQPGKEHNFNQHITDGDDVGAYDYGSIMHYERWAFSIDGSDTITPLNPPTAQIGQRVALSAGDIAAANNLCPGTKPLKEVTKDVRKDLPSDTIKEMVKDVRFDTRKELVLDTRKEQIFDTFKEQPADTRKEMIETIKEAGTDRIFPDPGLVINPQIRGGGLPFAVRTPHAAPAAGAAQGQLSAEQLDAQLVALADQLAQVESARDQLQAQYDETAALLAQALDSGQ